MEEEEEDTRKFLVSLPAFLEGVTGSVCSISHP
jgi:hypothetical protein